MFILEPDLSHHQALSNLSLTTIKNRWYQLWKICFGNGLTVYTVRMDSQCT